MSSPERSLTNPSDPSNFQFGLHYEIAQGDPTDPNTDWDPMSVVSGDGETGLAQAQAQYEQTVAAMASGNVPNVRNPNVVYASKITWSIWNQEQADGGSQEQPQA